MSEKCQNNRLTVHKLFAKTLLVKHERHFSSHVRDGQLRRHEVYVGRAVGTMQIALNHKAEN